MKPDQNVYYKKTYGKFGINLWHLIICKKKRIFRKWNTTIEFLKVNTLFLAIIAKAIENGFSAQEIRADSMRRLVIPAPPENLTVPDSLLM